MNGRPEVTVILPTYNWAEVLPYAIGSVLQQTLRDFELLVVGDGCTDNSEAAVRAVGDHRVRWINLPANTGHQAGPNNEGLRLSRGRIVAYIGHDDLWLPRHLELVTAAINGSTIFARGRALFVPPGAPPELRPGAGWNYWRGAWIPPTSLAHVRDAATAVGGWRFPADAGRLDPEADLCARESLTCTDPPRLSRTSPGSSSLPVSDVTSTALGRTTNNKSGPSASVPRMIPSRSSSSDFTSSSARGAERSGGADDWYARCVAHCSAGPNGDPIPRPSSATTSAATSEASVGEAIAAGKHAGGCSRTTRDRRDSKSRVPS